ncbi:MAG: hypothetical protein R3F13_13580 [Prosthecobacter sp.]
MPRLLKTIPVLLAALWMASCTTQKTGPQESPPLDEDGRPVMPLGPLFMPMR